MSRSKVTTAPNSSNRVGLRLSTACPMELRTATKSRARISMRSDMWQFTPVSVAGLSFQQDGEFAPNEVNVSLWLRSWWTCDYPGSCADASRAVRSIRCGCV